MALPPSGYLSDLARTQGEMRDALEDQRDVIAGLEADDPAHLANNEFLMGDNVAGDPQYLIGVGDDNQLHVGGGDVPNNIWNDTVVHGILTLLPPLAPASGGVPSGGAAGQALVKLSGTSYDVGWGAGGGGGAAPDEVVIAASAPTVVGGYPELWIDTASSPTGGGGITPINPAEFGWVNQGTATVTDASGVSHIDAPSATTNVRLRQKATPATPYTIMAIMEPYMVTGNNSECGILLRESGTDKMVGVCTRDNIQVGTIRYGSVTGAGISAPVTITTSIRRIWLRMVNNGTTLVLSYSFDGAVFKQLESLALTTGFTVAPNQAGYFVTPRGLAVAASFVSWEQA